MAAGAGREGGFVGAVRRFLLPANPSSLFLSRCCVDASCTWVDRQLVKNRDVSGCPEGVVVCVGEGLKGAIAKETVEQV